MRILDKPVAKKLIEELFDFTIEANVRNHARLTEILMAREEFCDFFVEIVSVRSRTKCSGIMMGL